MATIKTNGCVRLASPGRHRCVAGFFQDERVQIITHVRPGKKTPPHTGVDPGQLNEHTLYVRVIGVE